VFDIDFYMKVNNLKNRLRGGEVPEKQSVFDMFEEMRSRKPIIYNIETTNACNMRCKMCPRTTMMTRRIETMDKETFASIVDQMEPFPAGLWEQWQSFAAKEYGIRKDSMSENNFFLYIIPRVIQLHGYGDPLLDKNMAEHVRILTERGFLSYFSCNPANIDIERTVRMFENGLSFVKYSIESVDDVMHEEIRGKASNFTESYRKICRLLDIKAKEGFKTKIIITMLDLNRTAQQEEFDRLKKAFEGRDVYVYLKSEDQQWYRKDFHGTCSVHWSEFCRHPWMSMTIKSNGEAAMCMEDFNNEIILGDVRKVSLADIWNGERYRRFREDHFNLTKGIKCTQECDMRLVGHFWKT
jgi:radical SAM protein with 4Fe4S-binding SPASM domain